MSAERVVSRMARLWLALALPALAQARQGVPITMTRGPVLDPDESRQAAAQEVSKQGTQRDAHGLAVSDAAAPARPSVINLSMQKAGTSSFADFAWRSLNLTSFHTGHGSVSPLCFGLTSVCDPAKDGVAASYPDYEGWAAVYDQAMATAAVSSSGVSTFSDYPIQAWFIIDTLPPDTKFVIWPRPSNEWAHSWLDFFCPWIDDDRFALTGSQRNSQLSYGACKPCSLPREAAFQKLKKANENHLAAVRAFFSGDRRSRYHEMDYSNPLAGRRLCEFVYDAPVNGTRCAHLTGIPNKAPGELATDMACEASKALGKVNPKCTSPRAAEAC